MLFKTFLALFVLATNLQAANPNIHVGTSNFPAQECKLLLTHFNHSLEAYIAANEREYIALKKRVLSDKKVKEEEFNLFLIKLVHTFVSFEPRIRNSSRFDGNHVAAVFLRGVTVWAENLADIIQAVEIFFHANPYTLTQPLTEDGDLDLEYFAARMAWMVDRYEVRRNREFALEQLASFDDTNAQELNIFYDHSTGRVQIDRGAPSIISRLEQRGLRPAQGPLSPHKLQFNNGRRFHVWNLNGTGKVDLWVAQQLTHAHQGEFLLGLGDQSVRQFFRLIRTTEGYVNRFPFAADFLFIAEDRANAGQYRLMIREVKFYNPNSRMVDVSHALDQIQSTWVGLLDAFGHTIKVGALEVIVPKRALNLRGDLGNGYRIGRSLSNFSGHELSELLYMGRPHTMSVNGDTLPVRIRELPITDQEYKNLTSR